MLSYINRIPALLSVTYKLYLFEKACPRHNIPLTRQAACVPVGYHKLPKQNKPPMMMMMMMAHT